MMRRRRSAGARPTEAAAVYQLRVTLAEVEPPVWRQVRVRGDMTLDRLHRVLQRTMGWQDVHLHEWVVGERRYGEPAADQPGYDVDADWTVTLGDVAPSAGARFEYVYDLGDGWRHDIVVERVDPPGPALVHPQCIAGQRACPPEDCGGPDGYERLVAAIRDPGHPEHEERLAWVGGRFDPEAFDLAKVNRRLGAPRNFS